MKDRQIEEMEEIYHESGDLLIQLTNLNSKWLRVRDLINIHNYLHLNRINEQSEIMDILFSAEQQIRDMRNIYKKKIDDLKELEDDNS